MPHEGHFSVAHRIEVFDDPLHSLPVVDADIVDIFLRRSIIVEDDGNVAVG